MILDKGLMQIQKHNTLDAAEDNLAGVVELPYVRFAYIVEQYGKFELHIICDIKGNPVRSQRVAHWVRSQRVLNWSIDDV